MGKNNNNNNNNNNNSSSSNYSNSNEKSLQEQIAHLSNELEELRLEKEESKKNVLHFMQEADSARHELKSLQQQMFAQEKAGCLSPPPEEEESYDKRSILISRIRQLDKEKLNVLLDHVEAIQKGQSESPLIQIDKLTLQLKASQDSLNACKEQNKQLEAKIQQREQSKTTQFIERLRRESVQETERAIQSIKDESNKVIQTLNHEMEQYKLDQAVQGNKFQNELLLLQDKCKQFQEENEMNNKEHKITQEQFKNLQDKHNQLLKQHSAAKGQVDELEQAKVRENHLKIINRTLRDELRRPSLKVQQQQQQQQQQSPDHPLNIEYLRNVIIKFLEKRNARAQLIPVISMLLECGQEDQLRLAKIIVKAK